LKPKVIVTSLRRGARFYLLPVLLLSAAKMLTAHPAPAGPKPVQVLMVSDIHFEPFWDPGKVTQLEAVPASQWKAILASPPSPDRAERFAALQMECKAKGLDSDSTLFASSLAAMRANAPDAKFITVSGDLLAHDFACKYQAAVPHATAAGEESFAAKTLEYVVGELRGTFPGVPVYAALGNNDSGCGDYHLNPGWSFLRAIAPALSADLPEPQRGQARRDIAKGGYYSVALPAPMRPARLLILDDLFMSDRYATCGGKPDPAPAADQIAWLRGQLEQARRAHEKVWVMAHIPPGINPYSTIRNMGDVCLGDAPEMFLGSAALPETIAEFGDVVRLAIFAHTHMDELRLLRASKPPGHHTAVALKMVPSISPVDGNNPSFVVASVDPESAVLRDYRVVAASNKTGVETQWREEYDFDRTYGETEFSAASVKRMIAGFRMDRSAGTQAAHEYLKNYFVGGDESTLLQPFWPEYTCTLANDTKAGFRSCMCGDGQTH
jgi:sphingomyelin phosphodiesterase acid-like 3